MRLEEVITENGAVIIEPGEKVEAGSVGTWNIIYTVGEKGVAINGKIRITIPFGFSRPKLFKLPWDIEDIRKGIGGPTEPGYVSVKASNPETKLKLSIPVIPKEKVGMLEVWGKNLFITIKDAPLREGNSVVVTYGDTSFGSPGAVVQYFEQTVEFTVATDIYGDGCFYLVKNSPRLAVIGRKVSYFVVIIPSKIKEGEDFPITVVPRDKYGNATYKYQGMPQIKSDEAMRGSFELKGQHGRSALAKFSSSGTYRITAVDKDDGIVGISNPIAVTDKDNNDLNLYWGDLHVHTGFSDGLGTPDEAYRYARDISKLDFAACTDEDNESEIHLSDEEWELTKETANKYTKPAKFVAFPAYEYQDHGPKGTGHRNVYFMIDDQPILRHRDGVDLLGLYNRLKARNALVVPHHSVAMGASQVWNYHNPDLERIVEIYSIWGNSECRGCLKPHIHAGYDYEKSVQTALAKGYKLGFIASGDCHAGHPGYSDWLRWFRSYHNGLAAVYAPQLSRRDIWQALWKRHCYATTGERILLDFKLNGHMMGEEIILPKNTPREIRVKIAGTKVIKRVDLIRNNLQVYVYKGKSWKESFEYIDREDLKEEIFYYVRVIQKDGEMAWSSPIWVRPQDSLSAKS
ncbi:MAG: DUF3604 domain-containing protein [Clostridia bacterium]|nr:DUF3604 domain-containing protein [Clostridia bacterium]